MQSVFNWCSDFEMELGNAGVGNPLYYERLLRYASEFLKQFPGEDADRHISFTRAEGEALWGLGRRTEAEAVYAGLVTRVPDNEWGYIGWSDQYWLGPGAPKEYDRAEAILKRALATPTLQDRSYVLDRLRELYHEWGTPAAAAAAAQLDRTGRQPAQPRGTPSPPASLLIRPARNAPCWCGSGKKYKRCHLAADEAARRFA